MDTANQNEQSKQQNTASPASDIFDAFCTPTINTQKRTYSTMECIAAALIYALCFIFCRSFPFGAYPLGNFIVCILATLLTLAITIIKKPTSNSVFPYMFLLIGTTFSLTPIFTSNAILLFFCYAATLLMLMMYLYFINSNGTGKAKAEYIVYDSAMILFGLPFRRGANAVSALVSPLKKGKLSGASKNIRYILLGLALTLIPTLFVFVNLSFDRNFTELLFDTVRFDNAYEVFSYCFTALCAVPICMYIFSAAWQYVCKEKTQESRQKHESVYNAINNGKRIFPSVTLITAAIPLLFLYVVFFISQIEEYTVAFGNTLPEGYIYSAYARNGFFELCRVAGLNALFIFASGIFVKDQNKVVVWIQKAVTVLLCLCSLVLIATAMSKMLLYIDAYGMTQKRIYVALFMLLMAVGFGFAIIAQFIKKLKMTWVCMILASLMLIIPAVANIDAHIASYNVDRYMSGTLEKVDYMALFDYKEASMPALSRLYHSDKATEKDKSLIREIATQQRIEYDKKHSVFYYNIPRYNAECAINSILGGN